MMETFDDEIYSEQILGLTTRCPDCDETSQSTGILRHLSAGGRHSWLVEYKCPDDGIVFTRVLASQESFIDGIVRRAGRTALTPPTG